MINLILLNPTGYPVLPFGILAGAFVFDIMYKKSGIVVSSLLATITIYLIQIIFPYHIITYDPKTIYEVLITILSGTLAGLIGFKSGGKLLKNE